MTLLLETLAFALGGCLSIELIAALHGVVDFWYAIGREGARVLLRILVFGGIAVALPWLLAPPFRTALLAGLAGYAAFYLSLFVIRHPLLRALRAGNRASQPSDAG